MPNPFLQNISFRNSPRFRTEANPLGRSDVYTPDGEVIDNVSDFIKPLPPYDAKRFTKVYSDGWDAFIGLSHGAMKVMVYILRIMGYSDMFSFDVKRCMKEVGFKNRESVYRAVRELKEKSLIADCEEGGYYINPSCFYKGDRTKLDTP